MATRRSFSTRSHATTSSCPVNSSRLSSKTCAKRRPENDSPQSCSLAAGPLVVRKSAPADPQSRWLAVSVVRRDDESGSSPQRVSQPLGRRLRGEPDHLVCRMPFVIASLVSKRRYAPHRHSALPELSILSPRTGKLP